MGTIVIWTLVVLIVTTIIWTKRELFGVGRSEKYRSKKFEEKRAEFEPKVVKKKAEEKPTGERVVAINLSWGFLIFVLITAFVVYQYSTGNWSASKPITTPVQASTHSTLPFPELNAGGEKIVRKFWTEKFRPEEVEEMIRIAELESGFNQFEADGKTPLRGRLNSGDVGVMQINEGYWLKQANALGHNIYNLEGNLRMALWIRLHYGADEWNTSEEARSVNRLKPVILIAPVGVWGEKFDVSRLCQGIPNKAMKVRDSFGRIRNLDPDNMPTFKTWTVEYMTDDVTAGEVVMICR